MGLIQNEVELNQRYRMPEFGGIDKLFRGATAPETCFIRRAAGVWGTGSGVTARHDAAWDADCLFAENADQLREEASRRDAESVEPRSASPSRGSIPNVQYERRLTDFPLERHHRARHELHLHLRVTVEPFVDRVVEVLQALFAVLAVEAAHAAGAGAGLHGD